MNGGGGRRPGQRQSRRGGQRRGGGGRGPRRPDFDHGFPDVDAELDGQAGGPEGLDRGALEEKTVEELLVIAGEAKIEDAKKLRKPELVTAILAQKAEEEGFLYRQGVLDVLPDGYGFLRTQGYLPSEEDVYVSMSQIRRFGLRRGDEVSGLIRPPKDSEKYYALLRIERVNDMDPDKARQRPSFDKLTALFPDERLVLEHEPKGLTERILDLVCPIGKGQRGMVVSPPKAGKTTVLKQIANAVLENNPEVHVIVLLVDERPEEVTDWKRTVKAAEVVASTFDRPADDHIQVTELVLERAKRLVEGGTDVMVLLDSITRMARAYNLAAPASGKILSGGVDSTALYPPKRFFGAARNIEEGGSFTCIASCLVETGSRMDEVIFEEFKGTGNMEVRLDRTLAEKRLFPAINIEGSGTRKEELLMASEELALAWKLRRVLHALDAANAIELLIDRMKTTKSNADFMKEIAKAPGG
jgi:transcription termination factor Rho